MTELLTLDPGGTTGWSWSYFNDDKPLLFAGGGQIEGGLVGVLEFLSRIGYGYKDAIIVSESFQLRPGVKSPDVTPLRIEGALTALFGPDRVVYQQPALKASVGDQRLKDNGLWIPGQRHQMDARIHALAFVKRNKHLPSLRAYWPESEEN